MSSNIPQLYLLTYFVRRYVVDVSPEFAATRVPHDPHAVVRGSPTVQPIRSIDEVRPEDADVVPLCATVGMPGWNHPTWTVAQWATAGREHAAKRLQIVRAEQARLAEEAAEIERALGGVTDPQPTPPPAPAASIDDVCEALTERMRPEYPWCVVGHDTERLHFYHGTTQGGERRLLRFRGFPVEWHVGGTPIPAPTGVTDDNGPEVA